FAVFFRNTALQSFGVSAYAFKPAPCLAKKSLQNCSKCFAVFFRNTALQSFGVSAYTFKPAPCLAKKSLQNYLIIGAYACAHSPCSAPKFTRNALQSFSVIFALCRFAVSAYRSGDKTQ
ncbi:MAG: hypothetical protein ACI4K8_02230, partial [Candidatus Fimenecus sp.]